MDELMSTETDRLSIIHRLCQLQWSICDGVLGFSEPNDCFCLQDEPGVIAREIGHYWRHSGRTIEFIEAAVAEKIAREKGREAESREAFSRAEAEGIARLIRERGIDPELITKALA